MFRLARDLGKTVAELEFGRPVPLSEREFVEWVSFFKVEAHYKKQAAAKSKQESRR